ncbi:unnamed protein product [Peronospora belbahrii]|uniref:Uncharacterized protein n=1 Tax=Peronospora belbahrii TaxID=622444 RepID=A0AAU9L3F3_9STRA|nr:unnamed protein product [Peronospora belbahrii]
MLPQVRSATDLVDHFCSNPWFESQPPARRTTEPTTARSEKSPVYRRSIDRNHPTRVVASEDAKGRRDVDLPALNTLVDLLHILETCITSIETCITCFMLSADAIMCYFKSLRPTGT